MLQLAEPAPLRSQAGAVGDVLHVPYTFFPDPVGGTEIYVAGLAQALRQHGFSAAVAAPGRAEEAYDQDGLPVFRFATAPRATLDYAYGVPDQDAAASFERLLATVRPRIVHLHARSAAISDKLIDLAHAADAKVVFTYHTPTVSCVRGSLMWMGRSPCDGRLDHRRCTACNLALHGVPRVVGDLLAMVPETIGIGLGRADLAGGAFTALRMASLIGAMHRRFHTLMDKVDRVVAVCGWVADLLRVNGVPESKLVLCRQGLVRDSSARLSAVAARLRRTAFGPLRLGYFGRLDPTKGVDIVIAALRRVPDAPVRLDIYGIRQPGCEAYAAKLERAATGDPRIAFRPALPREAVGDAMQDCDFVVVPSRCLETGPLVVLEAFAAGTPILGARLGGIAELVSDQVDGVLVAPDDPAAWAAAIAPLAEAPERLARLRDGIRPPRTMGEVAREMMALYEVVLAAGGRRLE